MNICTHLHNKTNRHILSIHFMHTHKKRAILSPFFVVDIKCHLLKKRLSKRIVERPGVCFFNHS